jgi:hypothetical protein
MDCLKKMIAHGDNCYFKRGNNPQDRLD